MELPVRLLNSYSFHIEPFTLTYTTRTTIAWPGTASNNNYENNINHCKPITKVSQSKECCDTQLFLGTDIAIFEGCDSVYIYLWKQFICKYILLCVYCSATTGTVDYMISCLNDIDSWSGRGTVTAERNKRKHTFIHKFMNGKHIPSEYCGRNNLSRAQSQAINSTNGDPFQRHIF